MLEKGSHGSVFASCTEPGVAEQKHHQRSKSHNAEVSIASLNGLISVIAA